MLRPDRGNNGANLQEKCPGSIGDFECAEVPPGEHRIAWDVTGGARADQYRQDAIWPSSACWLGHGPGLIRPSRCGSSPGRSYTTICRPRRRHVKRRPHHRRRERDQIQRAAALLCVHGRGHAAQRRRRFLAIEFFEVQLDRPIPSAATSLHRSPAARAQSRQETLLLGAQTHARRHPASLIPGANFISRPRLSKLTYAGEKKITSAAAHGARRLLGAEVYAIAELIRRQRGGAAVVLGALSPRTRNAQVALYQSGDVDFLVATDAIGMGLNMDVDHVAFAGTRKFDGQCIAS